MYLGAGGLSLVLYESDESFSPVRTELLPDGCTTVVRTLATCRLASFFLAF